jgi:hypothetical protein
MKLFKIIGIIFPVIGLAALIGLVASFITTKKFIASSVVTKGEIIDIVTNTSTDSDGHTSKSRFPVIRFQDEKGITVEFQSSTSTSNGISIGQPVTVRYLPSDPHKAKRADSFMDLWFLTIICLIFGVVFTGLGSLSLWLGIRDGLREKRAKNYSKIIEAKVKEVVYNTSISMNGRSPYQIEAQWLDPQTNTIHIFKSKNIWYDPSEFVKEKVTVKADPQNLKKYWMDVSFLPEKA